MLRIDDRILDGTEVIQSAAIRSKILARTDNLGLSIHFVSSQNGFLRRDSEHVENTACYMFA